MVQSSYVRHYGLINLLEEKPMAKCLFVFVFVMDCIDVIPVWDMPVDLGVPYFVINAIKDTAELLPMDVKGMTESVRQFGMLDLPGITGRHGSHKVRIDDAGLHEVHGGMIGAVPEPVGVKIIIRPVESYGTQYKLSDHSLMHEVVQGITDAGMGHAIILVQIKQEYRHDPGLPVVTVDYVRMLVRLEHKLKGRPAEKSKPLGIIAVTVKNTSIKEVPLRMGFDKKAFSSMDKTEKDGAMHPSLIKRDPQVVIGHPQPVDLVIPHAVIFRKYDLDIVAPDLKFVAETVNNVCQAPHFGGRRAFGSDHHYVHL